MPVAVAPVRLGASERGVRSRSSVRLQTRAGIVILPVGPMTYLASTLFALTYLGMALGRIPGLRIDRTGIAMIAAVIIVATGAIPADKIASAVHFPTLLLLGGLMVLSARVGASGFYDAAAVWIAGQAGRPLRL